MTFYRVALQVKQASTYQWKSSVLSSLETVFGWLRMHRALPQERLRVFSSLSREGLEEQERISPARAGLECVGVETGGIRTWDRW